MLLDDSLLFYTAMTSLEMPITHGSALIALMTTGTVHITQIDETPN